MSDEKPTITFEDFTKLDLRVAKILEASEHPNADKLLVLQIEIGDEKRQLIAGLRAFYSPEDLVGREIVVVANLQPRKMRGLESQGMLLAAVARDEDDQMSAVAFITPEKEMPTGTAVS